MVMISDDKVTAINERIKEMCFRTCDGHWRITDNSVVRGILSMCDVDKLNETIADLQTIQRVLEDELGIKF